MFKVSFRLLHNDGQMQDPIQVLEIQVLFFLLPLYGLQRTAWNEIISVTFNGNN